MLPKFEPKGCRVVTLWPAVTIWAHRSFLRQLFPECLTGNPQDLRGFALVRLGALHRLTDVRPFYLRQRPELLGRRLLTGELYGLGGELDWQVLRLDVLRSAENDEAFDQVVQLAHVARPRVAQHQALGLRREALDRLVRAHGGLAEEVTR